MSDIYNPDEFIFDGAESHIFNGCEIIFFLDNNSMGEISGINVNSKTKELTIDIVIFNSMVKCHDFLVSRTNSKLLLVFNNIYGHKMYRVIEGIKYDHEIDSFDISDKFFTEKYVFNYEEISSYKEITCPVEELRNQVFN